MSVNKVIIIGHVGQEPMVRYVSGGAKIARFSVATSDRYTDKEGRPVEQTDWHNVECWGAKADLIEKWVHKGTQLFIEGKLKQQTYNKDGVTVTKAYISPESIQLLDKKPETAASTATNATLADDDYPED